MPSIPEDYELISDGQDTSVIQSSWKPRLLEDLRTDFSRIRPDARASFTGRARHFSYAPDGSSDRLLVRRIVRGGAVARVLGELHWGMARPFAELAAVVRARKAGLNVPEIVAVRARSAGFGFYRFVVVVKEVPGARDLLAFAADAPPSRRHRAIREVATAIRQLHKAGISHGDLNLKNILVSSSDGRDAVHLIDFDRAIVCEHCAEDLDLGNLARLNRSVEKWLGTRVTRTDKIRFLISYLQGRDGLTRVARECESGLWLHRLWWSITGARAS